MAFAGVGAENRRDLPVRVYDIRDYLRTLQNYISPHGDLSRRDISVVFFIRAKIR